MKALEIYKVSTGLGPCDEDCFIVHQLHERRWFGPKWVAVAWFHTAIEPTASDIRARLALRKAETAKVEALMNFQPRYFEGLST